ncbi:MAG: phosphotransferase [bacterium]
MDNLDTLARRAAGQWPQITSAPKLFMRRENLVYRVDTTVGPHALRLHRAGYHDAQGLQSELDLMAMLAQSGLLVPKPAPTADGTLLVTVDGRQASLLSWLPGQPMGRSGQPLAYTGPARTRLFHNIGSQMARLHRLTDQWTPPPCFARPHWNSDGLIGDAPVWGRFWDCGTPDDRAALLRLRGYAQQKLAEAAGDYGLIHADLVNENVLVDGDHVHFIDFDDSGYGYRLFDIATTLYKAVDEPDFPALQAALLSGYVTQRPLPDLTLLPLFIVLRAASYLGWIAARLAEPGMAAKSGHYLTIARRLIAVHLP